MTTEGIREADDHAPGVRSSWYVALAQLPGLPVKLRLEVVAIVSAALKALPVLARRDHFWSGSAHALAYTGEDTETLEDQMPEVPVDAAAVDAGREASRAF